MFARVIKKNCEAFRLGSILLYRSSYVAWWEPHEELTPKLSCENRLFGSSPCPYAFYSTWLIGIWCDMLSLTHQASHSLLLIGCGKCSKLAWIRAIKNLPQNPWHLLFIISSSSPSSIKWWSISRVYIIFMEFSIGRTLETDDLSTLLALYWLLKTYGGVAAVTPIMLCSSWLHHGFLNKPCSQEQLHMSLSLRFLFGQLHQGMAEQVYSMNMLLIIILGSFFLPIQKNFSFWSDHNSSVIHLSVFKHSFGLLLSPSFP